MQYSEKFKSRMVQRLTGPGARSATALSKEVGIAQGTLSRWLREAKLGSVNKPRDEKGKRGRRKRTPEEKYRLVAESTGLSGEELGAFLRREGLFERELEELRQEVRRAAVEGLRPAPKRRGKSPEQKRISKLEKELKRKEKALAEAAALLVLQGKVRAFLESEDDEEGDTNGNNEQ